MFTTWSPRFLGNAADRVNIHSSPSVPVGRRPTSAERKLRELQSKEAQLLMEKEALEREYQRAKLELQEKQIDEELADIKFRFRDWKQEMQASEELGRKFRDVMENRRKREETLATFREQLNSSQSSVDEEDERESIILSAMMIRSLMDTYPERPNYRHDQSIRTSTTRAKTQKEFSKKIDSSP
jgi:hypothetical protein